MQHIIKLPGLEECDNMHFTCISVSSSAIPENTADNSLQAHEKSDTVPLQEKNINYQNTLNSQQKKYERKKTNEGTCPLTMDTLYISTHVFFKDIIFAYKKGKKNAELDDIEKYIVENMEDLPPVYFAQCGHEFSAIPLIFNIIINTVKCPICRAGSGGVVNLEVETVENIPQEIWNCLRMLGEYVRQRHKEERELENEQAAAALDGAVLLDITHTRQAIQWVALFTVYNRHQEGNTRQIRTHRVTPFAVVAVPLHMRESHDNDMIVSIDSGHQ